MANDRNSYGSILKAIGLFGGVKIFQILVGIIRNKFVAVLLGPAGMGVVGLLSSTTNLIKSFTGFGLSTSTVRDISSAYSSGDHKRIGRVVSILRKLVWATGFLGAIITFAFAKHLSVWAFGEESYTAAFRILSVILIIDQLTVGQTALMQGTFHYRYMARSSLLGSVIGLVVSVPLYYLWGEAAIVPVMIIASLTALMLTYVFSKKINIPTEKVTFKDIITDGRSMIVLGAVLAATSAFRLGGSYLERIFISNFGSVADVGLYAAGAAIATQYIDVILSSMSTDYVPRLSAVSADIHSFNETINRQMKLMVTIILPVILLFIILVRELVVILYSTKFLPIIGMIEWMMFAMFFRTISWCLSFPFVAKGESKVFFWNESFSTVYSLVFSITGFYFAGFWGLGLAFLMTYICYSLQMYILARRKFDFHFSKDCMLLLLRQGAFLIPSFIIIEVLGLSVWRFIVGIVLLAIVVFFSYREMNKMIPFESVKQGIKNKFKRKIINSNQNKDEKN